MSSLTEFMSSKVANKAPPTPLLAAYIFFFGAAVTLYFIVSEGSISAILTFAELMQCLALLLLAAQVLTTGSCSGISARAVGLEALALSFRLSSTLWLNGYLPVDESGDWFYQSVDLCALSATAWLLYHVLVVHGDSYHKGDDDFPVHFIVLGALVMAAVFHADMNYRPVFDTLWMAGLFVGSTAVLPQLWLIMQTGGKVDPLMSHHIAVMALSRALSGVFMYMAREDITSEPWIEGINHAILAVLGAHLLHLLLLADFGYFYVKAVLTQGLACHIEFDNVSTYV